MLIGNKLNFAIECYHEPIANDNKHVFGRVCVYVGGNTLGDINEPTCILNVLEEHLVMLLEWIDSQNNEELIHLSDQDLFELLDNALYLDETGTLEEAKKDSEKYYKYDFLTNASEAFDGTKSFVISDGPNIRIMFTDISEQFHSSQIPKEVFHKVTTSFINWVREEEQKMG